VGLPRAEMAAALRPTPARSKPKRDLSAEGQAAEGQAAEPRAKPQPDLTDFERIAAVWPTYEVHVYHALKEWTDEKGRKRVRLGAQIPFGYFVDHEGPVWGWDHAIAGLEGAELEPIAPNYYKVKVPNDGAIKIKTSILAKERADEAIGEPPCPSRKCPGEVKPGASTRCSCEVVGRETSYLTGFGLAGALVTLVTLRLRWRRRREPRRGLHE
jgi:hypothetical protein